jgi:hypothetical protein
MIDDLVFFTTLIHLRKNTRSLAPFGKLTQALFVR